MTKYSQSLLIVPCHSMEDFPTHFVGRDAENLLACWTATWHPALLATSQVKPEWQSVDYVEIKKLRPLIVVPNVARSLLGDDFFEIAARQQATVISEDLDRAQIIQLALHQNEAATVANERMKPLLIDDFMALGYAYLQIQIMTRQLRNSSNLDEEDFFRELLATATLASEGNQEKAQSGLVTCFDLLQAEKNSYYPVQPDLIDLVLTARSTLGASMTRQFECDHNLNLLITGRDAGVLAKNSPAAVARIREHNDDGKLSIVGGLESELPDPLLSSESIVRQFQQGVATLQRVFGVEPVVFGRRRFGLTPALPGLLDQFNYIGAIHATLDDGKFPQGSSSNIRWTGIDGESIMAYGNLPLHAEEPGTFLGLGLKIGEAIDSAHVATFVFAHWPDQTCDAYKDLLRISSFGPLLGKFIRIDDFFDQIYDPGYGDSFSADEYKQPYLKQAIASRQLNPISRFSNYWQNYYRLTGCRALYVQLALYISLRHEGLLPVPLRNEMEDEIVILESQLDHAVDAPQPNDQELSSQIIELENRMLTIWSTIVDEEDDRGDVGRYFVNTTNATRREVVSTNQNQKIALRSIGQVIVADSGSETTDWVLEFSGMSIVRLPKATAANDDPFRAEPPVSTDLVLRNEFFELQVDQQTGGIRSVQHYGGRQNLFSQKLALRIPGQPDSDNPKLTRARYSEMVADEVKVSADSRIQGDITSSGRLVDQGATVAKFQQTVRVTRGMRVFDLELEISPEIELSDSVNHYFCNRIAWKDESAQVNCNAQEVTSTVTSDWFLATNFIEIQQADDRVTVLTGGLPYHRRVSRRMLDNLLIVGNEQKRKFCLGIGTGLRYPLAESNHWMTPLLSFEAHVGAEKNSQAGWLFHFDCKNILVTWWRPVIDSEFRLTGVEVRLRETEGRSGILNIRCLREIASAERVNFVGDFLRSIEPDDSKEKLPVEFVGLDYFQIRLNWKT